MYPILENNPAESAWLKLQAEDEVLEFDLTALLQEKLTQLGYETQRHEDWLHHAESGFYLYPAWVNVSSDDEGHIHTSTTIQIHHHKYFPDGIFEYQHSTHQDLVESFLWGFDLWIKGDFQTLLCLINNDLNLIAYSKEYDDYERTILFGNLAYYQEHPKSDSEKENEEHEDGCPCCLLFQSFPTEVLEKLLDSKANFAIRLFACRDSEGEYSADCRINGEEYNEELAHYLIEYAKTWEKCGLEFRKQYVLIITE